LYRDLTFKSECDYYLTESFLENPSDLPAHTGRFSELSFNLGGNRGLDVCGLYFFILIPENYVLFCKSFFIEALDCSLSVMMFLGSYYSLLKL
jgi:hypothetical protein